MPPDSADWWRDAVVYQVYPRSFGDASGDGVGDLRGVTAHLDALGYLGVDAVWLSPFYRSPQADGGYDVSDHRDVDPLFGTLADFDALTSRCHDRGIKVIVDIVPNHSSDEHPWFQAALSAAPGSPDRARYLFRDGRGPGGDRPPNNWRSITGGPAWTRVSDADGAPGQWYLHIFDSRQPDFDWSHPAVAEEFRSVLRFWLDRGVDGFRVDCAHALVKEPGLPDEPETAGKALIPGEEEADAYSPMWKLDGVHEVYRDWRRLLDGYAPPRIMVAEATVPPVKAARFVRSDEMHQAFNFAFLTAPWDAARRPGHRRPITGRGRRRRRSDDLGAVQPRRGPSRHPVRPAARRSGAQRDPRDRPATRPPGGAAAGPRGDPVHARSAGLGVPVPGGGVGPAGTHRPGRQLPAGTGVLPLRPPGGGPGRLPGADAVGR